MRLAWLPVLLCANCTTVEPTRVLLVYVDGSVSDAPAVDSAGLDSDLDSVLDAWAGHDATAHDAATDVAHDTLTDTYPHTDSGDAPQAADGATDAQHDAPVDTATQCEGPGFGQGCLMGDPGWRDCCPGLVCAQNRCVDTAAGADSGATVCECHCEQVHYPDGGTEIDCTHGGCGCQDEGPVTLVQAVGSGPALCPPLWVCYGPYVPCNTVWIPAYDGDRVGGYCKDHENVIVQCAPCYAWKPC